MEGLVIIALLIPIGLLVGGVLGIVAFGRVNALKSEVEQLKRQLALFVQDKPVDVHQNETAPQEHAPPPALAETSAEKQSVERQSIEEPGSYAKSRSVEAVKEEQRAKVTVQRASTKVALQRKPSAFMALLTKHWMVWLGGLCVALAGIFLARYSIEQGLLGPLTRIVMGLITGLGLHAAALYVRAKFGGHPALAALAGGGSITLFASLLAALHLYHMFSPYAVFIILAIVALATMWMALLHGPILAAIGMIGAYAVPALVSTGDGNVVAAMAYALIIFASVLLLIRQLTSPTRWYAMLWWGMLAGALFWWFVSLTSTQAEGLRGLYLALLGYGLIAFSQSNWKLNAIFLSPVWLGSTRLSENELDEAAQENPAWQKAQQWLAPSLLLLIAAQTISVVLVGWESQWLNWSLLAILLLWVAGKQPKFSALAWLLFIGEWLALLLPALDDEGGGLFLRLLPPESIGPFFSFIFGFAAVFVLIAFRNLRIGHAKNWWAAMVAVVPVLTLLICHLLGASFTSDWQWALLTIILGGSYVALAVTGIQKQWTQELYVWLFLAGHFAYSFAATILLEQATLTLAIALQVLSVAWLIRRFDVSHLGWLLKTIVTLVVIRLTLNPWLASYPVDGHWPLWTYGGATVCCLIATRWLGQYRSLARWTEAATLHLFVLTVWSVTRYWLHEGDTFHSAYTFSEAVLNCLLFGALSLVYHYKAQLSKRMHKWYQGYSLFQLGFSACNYVALVIAALTNSSWSYASIGTVPLWNILLVAYGLPIALAFLVYHYYLPQFRMVAAVVSALAGFLFVSLEIRHLWQGSIRLDTATSVGELYTYSVVWMLMAVAALLLGSWRFGKRCYQGGLILIGLVIAKIFFVDMDGLDGLLRVASFMGLGLALLAVAFLHQKLTRVK